MKITPEKPTGLLWSLFLAVLLLSACGVQVGKVYISETLTCREVGPEGEPVGVTSSFPYGTRRVYFFFDLEGPVSAPLEIRWFHEGALLIQQEARVPPGVAYTWLEAEEPLETGYYRVEVVMGEVVMAEQEFVVESGPSP